MSTYNIPSAGRDSLTAANERNQEQLFDLVRRLGEEVSNPAQAIVMDKKDHVGLYVPSAEYGGFASAQTRSIISCAPGASFSKQIEITGNAIIFGAFLDCEGNTPAILIKESGRAIIQGCHLTKKNAQQTAATDSYISVETGGYVSVNGCFFHGLQTDTGTIVHNAGAGANAAVVGCVNLTDIVTTPYVNVTYTQDVP